MPKIHQFLCRRQKFWCQINRGFHFLPTAVISKQQIVENHLQKMRIFSSGILNIDRVQCYCRAPVPFANEARALLSESRPLIITICHQIEIKDQHSGRLGPKKLSIFSFVSSSGPGEIGSYVKQIKDGEMLFGIASL